MDKITAKIRNYRSTVRYATEAEAKEALKKKLAFNEKWGRQQKYSIFAWFSMNFDRYAYYTIERVDDKGRRM